jgi:hypothetical protein
MCLGFLSCEIAIRRFNHDFKFKKPKNGKGNQENNGKI